MGEFITIRIEQGGHIPIHTLDTKMFAVAENKLNYGLQGHLAKIQKFEFEHWGKEGFLPTIQPLEPSKSPLSSEVKG